MDASNEIAFYQGIADWLRYKTKCPPYWRGQAEEKSWHKGFNYARNYNR